MSDGPVLLTPSAKALENVPDGERGLTIVGAIKQVLGGGAELTAEQVYDRIVEGKLYSFGAADPKGVVRSQLRRHTVGLDFASASPVKYFRLAGDDQYALECTGGVRPSKAKVGSQQADRLPEEIINDAHKEHLAALRHALETKIAGNHPVFFEHLVIELLIKMGYGGGDPNLGIHTGKSGDGGIDGFIKEDQLGLGKIYIQAKRYKPDRTISTNEFNSFAGAMDKVQKGVFITTAKFSAAARGRAEKCGKSISLIDGDLLCELMIRYGLGVTLLQTYSVMRVDNDYFSPEQ